jgi:tetratricopeptide (TPR) repeat protein
MKSADLGLDVDFSDQTDEVPVLGAEPQPPAKPRWIASGTIAPPIHEGSGEELVEILEQRIAAAPIEEHAALYKQLGQVWEEQLGRDRNALDAWRAADRIDGDDLETLRSLARLYRSTQAWDELAHTLRRVIETGRARSAIGEDEIIELFAQLGELEGDVLRRGDEAIDAWRQVIAIDPSDARALRALENLYVRELRWDDALDVLEQRALVLDDERERNEALLQAAAICEEHAADVERAAQIYARVRAWDPANEVAFERLEAIRRQQAEWPELVELLLERAELVADVEQQVRILHGVAKIYEDELADQESAFYVLQAAFNRSYSNDRTASELERLATATGRWQELLDEYAGHVEQLERGDRAAAADLWVKIGRWYGEHLAQLEYAVHSVQQALRIDPAHAGALAMLVELQRARGSWIELVETLQRRAELEANAETKAALYIELAETLERDLHDAGAAIDAYRRALDHATSPTALGALERLYRGTAHWEPLVDVLQQRVALSDDDRERATMWLEIGAIRDEQLHDDARAIVAYQRALEMDPQNLGALRALDALYEKTKHAAEPHRAVLDRIVAIDASDRGAYRTLARLHEQAGHWETLVDTYRSHLAAAADVAERVELCCAMGRVYETQLHDLERAIDAYNDALALAADEPRALDALARLYEETHELERAAATLIRLVQRAEDARKRVELSTRLGRLQLAGLADGEAAEASLERALALEPNHVPAMEALIELYRASGAWLNAARMMVRAEGCAQVVLDRVRLLFEAASIYQHRLHDDAQAKQLYAAAIALDPEHVDSGRPLADMYFHDQQWIELRPVIEMLCRKVGALRAQELNELYYRAARCTEELGDHQRALQHYKAAHDIDPTYTPTLIGRADLLFKLRDWEGAGKIYQMLLAQHGGGPSQIDVARIYHRLGLVRQATGERKKALAMFDRVLEHDPARRETLEAIVELRSGLGDWEAVVRAKRGIAANAEPTEKAQLLDQIGGICNDKLANPQKAAAAYGEALDAAPNDRRLLQKLLDLYTNGKQWKSAVETIERLAALESDPFRKGVYLNAAATVCRDELKSPDDAVVRFDLALDSFFAAPEQLDEQQLARALKSFESIDTVLTAKRDWSAQERAYRAMIERLEGGAARFDALRVRLFDALGEIYRSRLKQHAEAIAAFEIAQQLDPDNALRADTDRAEILAELHVVAGPDSADKAIDQHRRMLDREPFKYDSYTALARLYADTHQHDKRWCLSRTLAFLRKASADEVAFYEQYKPRGLVKPKHAMTPDVWSKLKHADENRDISAIFGACWQSVAAMKAFPHKDLGIKREDRRELAGDPLVFSKLFLHAAQMLNVVVPDVFLIDDGKTAEIQLANTIDKKELCPSFMVRPHLLQGKTEREIAFLSARRLAYLYPEYFLRLLLPTNTELMVVLLSATAIAQPGFAVPPNMATTVQQYVPEMRKRLAPHALDQLAAAAQRFIKAAPALDLAKWSHAVDAATHRAGFVVCGDLEVAARTIAAEPPVLGAPKIKDKLKELVLFSISEELFAVRARLGIAI